MHSFSVPYTEYRHPYIEFKSSASLSTFIAPNTHTATFEAKEGENDDG